MMSIGRPYCQSTILLLLHHIYSFCGRKQAHSDANILQIPHSCFIHAQYDSFRHEILIVLRYYDIYQDVSIVLNPGRLNWLIIECQWWTLHSIHCWRAWINYSPWIQIAFCKQARNDCVDHAYTFHLITNVHDTIGKSIQIRSYNLEL